LFRNPILSEYIINARGHGVSDGLVAHIPDINPVVDGCISFFDNFRASLALADMEMELGWKRRGFDDNVENFLQMLLVSF
jgi:hypothetical protein